MEQQALGVLRLSLSDYEDINVGEFWNMITGHYEHANARETNEWDRVHFMAFQIQANNPYLKERPASFKEYKDRALGEGSAPATIKNMRQIASFIPDLKEDAKKEFIETLKKGKKPEKKID